MKLLYTTLNRIRLCERGRKSSTLHLLRCRQFYFPSAVTLAKTVTFILVAARTGVNTTELPIAHPIITTKGQLAVTPRSTNFFENTPTINDSESEVSSKQLPDTENSNRVDIEGYTLGDKHRSEASSASFFSSIDRDGDGTLRRTELSNFLRDKVGGEEFDTNEEREQEIENVLTRLDLNADDGLDEEDVMSYWKKNLDGLFGVEDVAEWIVNAAQLPNHESTFCSHHVTGYDFPELVENNGSRLETELGITNYWHRKKITKLANARMVGIESSLPKVELDTPVVTCNSVALRWKKVESNSGYPVHKYRVQRLAVPKDGEVREDTSVTRAKESWIGVRDRPCKDHLTKPAVNWETVHDEIYNEYVDSNIEVGFEYTYRIEAWNALGRSSWVSVSEERKWWKRCHQKSREGKSAHQPNNTSKNVINVFSLIQNVFYASMMIGGFMFRLQLYNNAASNHRYFSAVKKFANKVSQHIFGKDILPDNEINISERAVDLGIEDLDGYNKLLESYVGTPVSMKSHRSKFDHERKVSPEAIEPSEEQKEVKKKKVSIFKRRYWKKKLQSDASLCTTEASTNSTKLKQKNFFFKSLLKSSVSPKGRMSEDWGSIRCNSSIDSYDSLKRCGICNKQYKIFKRRQHHCSVCFDTFCHKHGKCTHAIGTPCPVPGTCVCQKCLNSF